MNIGRQLRTQVKRAVSGIPALHDLAFSFHSNSRRSIFSRAYAVGTWGSTESGSGIGSELGATQALREYLPDVLRRLRVRRLLDAPCGDWNWMRCVDLKGIDYIGADIVPEVIANNQAAYGRPGVRFSAVDLTKDELPQADIILCRDCWIHLSFRDAAFMLENFRRSGAAWLLLSNSPKTSTNQNQLSGLSWRYLNLHRPPFNFPPALELRKDHYAHTEFEMTLWKIADLPKITA